MLHRRAADAAALRRRLPALSTEQTSGGTAFHQLQEVRTSERKHQMHLQHTQLCAAQRTGYATQSRPSVCPRGCLWKAWQRVLASSAAMPSARASEQRERGHNHFWNPGPLNFFLEAFVVNSTNPMVLCERSFVAVAHTHTPCRTARPPTAPPRRERDEEMGQQRRSTSTYGRVQ